MAGAAQTSKDPELEAWAEAQVAKAPPLDDEIAARIARALGLTAPPKDKRRARQ